MRLAITMTHASRPKYTQRSLASVLAAREAIGRRDVRIYAHVEPGNAATISVCQALARPGDEIVVNALRKFVNRNTVDAIDHGFATGADFVIHCEDDILMAPDALAFMLYAAERFTDPVDYLVSPTAPYLPLAGSIMTVTGYHREAALPPWTRWWEVRSQSWFHPWLWGTWADRWALLRAGIVVDNRTTWDIQLGPGPFVAA